MLVEHVNRGQPAALADFKVIKVMRRCDFHRTRPFFRVGIFIRHNRDKPPDNRQYDIFTNKVFVALIVRMHGNAGIAQHGFGARGGDGNVTTPIFQRIIEMPKVAIGLALLDFEVGNRRQQARVPINEAFVFVNQPLLIQCHENLEHGFGQAFIHSEALTAPIATCAEAAQLAGNGRAAFFFPLPNALKKFLAAHFAAAFIALLGQLPLNHHLRRNAGMVCARLPQHIAPTHALKTAQYILQRIVQRMAHMQAARHIGRRNDNGVRLSFRHATGFETALVFPRLVKAGFDCRRVKGFVELATVSHYLSRAVTCS